jgi:hypothetical protein
MLYKNFFRLSLTATAGILLLLLSCCKQPIQPVIEPPLNFDEPDTIKSFVSFTLTAPLWNSYKWELNTPADTFSKGAVTSTGIIMRPQLWRVGGVIATNFVKSQLLIIDCSYSSNLITKDFIHPNNSVLDALRSWQQANLKFAYKLPLIITPPIKLDTLSTFLWSDQQYQEQFVSGNSPTSWSILPFVSDVFSEMKYWHVFWQRDTTFYSEEEQNLYRTRVERAEFYLDRYDTVRQRVDGRFSFRMIGYNGTVIDIKDGRFVNVRLNRTRD